MSEVVRRQAHRERVVMSVLGYAGLLPFACFLMFYRMQWQFFGLDPVILFVSYSAIILTFLSGIVWGRSLHADQNKLFFLIISNVFTLLAWVMLITRLNMIAIALLGLAFVVVCYVELRQPANVDKHYIAMRIILTVGVAILHALMAIPL